MTEGYASGGDGGRDHEALRAANKGGGYPHVLISYVYDFDGTFLSQRLGYRPRNWLGDSGAFTRWTQDGAPIDLAAYARWCLDYRAINPRFQSVTLDVIPGTRRDPKVSNKVRQAAIDQSIENGDELRNLGIGIWEVYHLGEPIEYLDRLLDRRRPGERVALGGLAGKASAGARKMFCDTTFAHLRHRYGWANLPPIHGLGMAPISVIGSRYPWRSMDSSSWISAAMFGNRPSKLGGKAGDDARTKAPPVRLEYLVRSLEAWLRTERMLGETWHRRGVRFQP